MKKRKRNSFSFQNILKILSKATPIKITGVLISLIFIGSICNYSTTEPLPMFWLLVVGFLFVICITCYSICQTQSFYEKLEKSLCGDHTLFMARKKLWKRLNSNSNLIISLFVSTCIVPPVVFIIKIPMGVGIKLFAYTSLYFIIALCIIGYLQYIYLIMLSFELSKKAQTITCYDKNRPHKTIWIDEISLITNRKSNLFFLIGSSYIGLLYLITFSGFYHIQIYERTSRIVVVFLWSIIIGAIVIMFPIFSFLSYISIKRLITKLKELAIQKNEKEQKIVEKKDLSKSLKNIYDIKILLLEETPTYPRKPLIGYAMSCIIAIINLGASIEAALSLAQYIL